MNIGGKSVLVTGAAMRVGAEIVRAFAEKEGRVVIHCRNSRAAALELLGTLPHPERHRIVTADLAVPGEAEELFAECGPVDILVNNASLYRPDELASGDELGDREHFEVNFWSPLALMRAFARQTLTAGAIVNILDQEVVRTTPAGGIYALSRRALADATLELARELAFRNIRVNAVAPGPVLPPAGLENSKMEKTLKSVPLNRKVGMGDLTEAVLFLAANDSITGQILCVDCGQHLT